MVAHISYEEADVAAVPDCAFPNQMSYLCKDLCQAKLVDGNLDTYETSARMPSDSVR